MADRITYDNKVDGQDTLNAAEVNEIKSAVNGNATLLETAESAIAGKANASHSHTVSQITDLVDALVKTMYENNADTNALTDALLAKLNGIEAGATADMAGAEIATILFAESNVNNFDNTAKTIVASAELNAKDDQTGPEIKALYEAEADTNALTDALLAKLNGLESSKFLGTYTTLSALQTAHPSPAVGSYGHVDGGVGVDTIPYVWDDDDNQYVAGTGGVAETAGSIKTKYESNADTNALTDALLSKLQSIVLNLAGFFKNYADEAAAITDGISSGQFCYIAGNLNRYDGSSTFTDLTANLTESDIITLLGGLVAQSGTTISMTSTAGIEYGTEAAPITSGSLTVSGTTDQSFAIAIINMSTEPTVTGATKMADSADFVADKISYVLFYRVGGVNRYEFRQAEA